MTGLAATAYARHCRLDVVQVSGFGSRVELGHFRLHFLGIFVEFSLVSPDFGLGPVVTALIRAIAERGPWQFASELG